MDKQPDFVLRRRPGNFSRPSGQGVLCPSAGCCCCCCLDILGAWAGAWVGGLIAGGIAYRGLRRQDPSVRSYWWAVLWNFVVAFVLVAITASLAWVGMDSRAPVLLALLTTLAFWALLATPICCVLVAQRFSGKVLGASLVGAVLGAIVGFAIGAAIMGGSVIFGGL